MSKKNPMTRSQNMSRVRSKNTKPEVYLRKLLRHKGYRYRINYKELPGSPDIYLSKFKTAIFVNGCFRHMHKDCRLSSIPKTNYDFRKEKLEGNVERDIKNYKKLEDMGIKVILVRGCEIKGMVKNKDMEKEWLKSLENILSKSEI